eukprot:TRINITY_DN192_c0_g1_i1.p1 TRINITY_DN192_c0_g1~~TRINITY_DN192_c0_g1_i1.p1  ORF type:complete len:339 (+),score=66.97 TRINITY_DN192_c0_g1_i1:78-1019(+)
MAQKEKKIAIVTGASAGIGVHIAKGLALHGFKVILACRSQERAEAAIKLIRDQAEEKKQDVDLVFLPLDLSSLASVRNFANKFLELRLPLQLLVNNAGCNSAPVTEDGYEGIFQANYLSHFYLTELLLDTLRQSAPSRIVNVASVTHRFAYPNFEDVARNRVHGRLAPLHAYNNSKLAQLIYTYEFNRRYTGSGVTAFAVHPGGVNSNIYSNKLYQKFAPIINPLAKYVMLTTEQGAATALYASLDAPESEASEGYYSPYRSPLSCCIMLTDMVGPFKGPNFVKTSRASYRADLGESLWTLSKTLIKDATKLS